MMRTLRLVVACLCCLGAARLGAAEQLELAFSEELGLGDLELAGQRASREVAFFMEPGTTPLPGSTLHLVFQHSPALDAERSFLSVSLNHGTLRSFRLDRRDGTVGELTVDLPAGMLAASNRLVFSVAQAAPDEERTWTRILERSSISLRYEPAELEWTLADLPAPLLYRSSYAPRRLSVLLPREPSALTVEATALAVAQLASRVAPEPVSLEFVDTPARAGAPVLAVGTPQEQPALRGLSLSRARIVAGAGVVTPEGHAVPASTGVIGLLPRAAGGRPLLLLTGNSPEAVGRAVAGLAQVARPDAGRIQMFPDPPRASPAAPRVWLGFAPPRTRFTLADVGDDQAELAVGRDAPARVRIRVTPDARFLGYGHSARLVFRALPDLAEDPDAALEVYWNDVLLRQAPLPDLVGGPSFSLSLRVPADLLEQSNVLTVAWNGRSGAPGPFVSLEAAESELSLPRDFVAQLPDLGLLRSSLFPLSLRADLSDAIVVAPEGDARERLMAVCDLAALLGQRLPGGRMAFRVVPAGALGAERAAANLVFLESGADSSVAAELPPVDPGPLPQGEALRPLPVLEARVSPWNEQRHALLLRASSPELLRAALRSLARPAFLSRLSGDTAFLAAEGPQCFRLTPQRTVAEISYQKHLDAWLRDNWIALPAILALVSGILFMGLRLALQSSRPSRERGPASIPTAAG